MAYGKMYGKKSKPSMKKKCKKCKMAKCKCKKK